MVRAACKESWTWFPAAAVVIVAALLSGCAHPPAETPAGPDSQEAAGTIRLIGTAEEPGAAVVRVEGLGPLAYNAVKRPEPAAVLFYFPNTRLAEDFADQTRGGALIASVAASEIEDQRPTVRVEIALAQDLPYVVERGEGGLSIRFLRPPAAVGGKGAEPIEETLSAAPPPGGEAAPAKEPAGPAATRLLAVSAVPLGNGTLVRVKADGRIEKFTDFTLDSPPRIVVDIPGVRSLSEKEESLLVNSAWVQKVRYFGDKARLRLVLDTRKAYLTSYTAAAAADGLAIQVLDPGAAPARAGAPAVP